MNNIMPLSAFGHELLRTGDLDPVYIMLVNSGVELPILRRWCLAYWCFYHCGVSSRIAEAEDFWGMMRTAYHEKWPRGTERRHFRGPAALTAIEALQIRYDTPESIIDHWSCPTFRQVQARVQSNKQFGPWIAFKVADMLDRVLRVPVDFSDCDLEMYRDPRQGAALYLTGDWRAPITGAAIKSVVQGLIKYYSDTLAPPYYDRPVNLQEVETILCKYKSYYKGHYPVGKDTRDYREHLKGWGPLAAKLREHLPDVD